MDIKIEEKSDVICVDDGEITYQISFDKPHNVYYDNYHIGVGMNVLFIPYVSNLIESCEDYSEALRNNHSCIKECLIGLSNILDNLPKLVICGLPMCPDFDPIGKFIRFENGDCMRYDDRMITYNSSEYELIIYFNVIDQMDFCANTNSDVNLNNIYFIKNKLVFTDEPYNDDLFTETIRSYVSNNLIGLADLFKTNNTKSAKN